MTVNQIASKWLERQLCSLPNLLLTASGLDIDCSKPYNRIVRFNDRSLYINNNPETRKYLFVSRLIMAN